MSETRPSPRILKSSDDAAAWLYAVAGRELKLATPLGLGKPIALLNALYAKAKANPEQRLEIQTALSLNPPAPGADLAKRFFGPFRDRHWGKNYPILEYARDAAANRLPGNVRIQEFYVQAGAALGAETQQRNYVSLNYTHVASRAFEANLHAIVQLVARRGDRYSLSCNPDVTLDLVEMYRQAGKPLLMIGVVHPELPFLGGEAEVPAGFFDGIVDDPDVRHELFALPKLPVDSVDHAIGFLASQLVADGGTLQIGIGSLGDAIAKALVLRQTAPAAYARAVRAQWAGKPVPGEIVLETSTFRDGLYGLSEMVMDGFMHLRRAGVLKREVLDDRTNVRTYLHGAFYLGSKEFYAWLRGLHGDEAAGLRMGRVSKVNDLYDPHEVKLRLQRKKARFFNTCMQVTLLGGAASETLEDGRVVSGVGGQYNFVAMSHELPDSRSILMLRSTRTAHGKRRSNLVWSHGHLTIPRHLRDVVITEYGIADLRGRSDEECVRRLIEIADAEFQDELVACAQKHGKVSRDYVVPSWARRNTPEVLETFVRGQRSAGFFAPFPFGSDFTPEEERLALALGKLQAAQAGPKSELLKLWRRAGAGDGYGANARGFRPELERMRLAEPRGLTEKLYRRLLVGALASAHSLSSP